MFTSESATTVELVKAAVLEQRKILPKSSAYRMAKAGLLPYYRVGARQTGIRFNPSEVIEALRNERRPVKSVRQIK